jgi:tetratricopeptide (TPR) repeat protein
MSEAWKNPKIVGQSAGAAVFFIAVIGLSVSTVFHWLDQRNIAFGVKTFFSLSQAETGERKEDRSQAKAALVAATRADPTNAGAFLLVASSALQNKKLDRAEQFFKRSGDLNPDNPDPWLGAAVVTIKRAEKERGHLTKSAKKAEEYLEKAVAGGADFEADVIRGAMALLKGEKSKALKIYKTLDNNLRDLDSGFPSRDVLESFYWNKGLAELLANSLDCLTSFQQALQLRPQWPEASDVLSRSMESFLSEKVAEKEARVRIAICTQIRDQSYTAEVSRRRVNRYGLSFRQIGRLNNAIGMTLFRLKDYPEAQKSFEKALGTNRSDVVYNRNLALTYQKLLIGEKKQSTQSRYHDKAAHHFSDAAKHGRRLKLDKEYLYKLSVNGAWHFNEIRKKTKALTALEGTIKLGVNLAEIYRSMGIVNMKSRSLREAEKWFLKAIEAGHPDSSELEIIIQSFK